MGKTRLFLSFAFVSLALALALGTLALGHSGHSHAANPSPTGTARPFAAIRSSISSTAQGHIYFGDDGNSIYAFNLTTGTLLWRYIKNPAIQLTSLMTVSGGRVFLDLFGNAGTNRANLVVALAATSGSQLWATSIAGYGPPITALFAANGVLYFKIWSYLPAMYALRMSDGTLLWQNWGDSVLVGSQGEDYLNAMNTVSEPVQWACAVNAITGVQLWCYQFAQIFGLGPGVVYATVLDLNNPSATAVVALRASDGSLLWSYGGPTVATFAGNSVYALTFNSTAHSYTLCALSARTGTPRWCDASVQYDGSMIKAVGGVVYVSRSPLQVLGASDGKLLWTENAGPLFVSQGVAYLLDWSTLPGSEMLIAHGDRAPAALWQNALGTGKAAGCHIPVSGILYCISADGQVLDAFNVTNGSLLWRHVFASSASILTITNGIVYAQTSSTANGRPLIGFHAFAAGTGTLLWTTSVR